MEIYIIITVLGIIIMSALAFFIGKKSGGAGDDGRVAALEAQAAELQARITAHEQTIAQQNAELRQLTAERDGSIIYFSVIHSNTPNILFSLPY